MLVKKSRKVVANVAKEAATCCKEKPKPKNKNFLILFEKLTLLNKVLSFTNFDLDEKKHHSIDI